MTSQRTVYVSGSFVPESEAGFSIFDSALMYGDVIFETTRTFNGQPFRLREHIERLYVGLRTLEIDCGLTAEEMEAATLETIERNRPVSPTAGTFRSCTTSRAGRWGCTRRSSRDEVGPTVTINCWPLTWHLAAFAEAYVKGVHAVVPAQRSVPSRLIDPKIKNRSRIYYQMANLQAQKVDPEALGPADGRGRVPDGGDGVELFRGEGRRSVDGGAAQYFAGGDAAGGTGAGGEPGSCRVGSAIWSRMT